MRLSQVFSLKKTFPMTVRQLLNPVSLTCVFFIFFSGQLFRCYSQIGRRLPSEKRVVRDPVTGAELTFLTSKPGVKDSKIYQTHNQWTADEKWLLFRSDRLGKEAIAVNEETGDMVQATEGGYAGGYLIVSRKTMTLYVMRQAAEGKDMNLVKVDLGRLFEDSRSGKLKPESHYQKICGTIPADYDAHGDMALDADESWIYFRVGKEKAAKHLPPGTKIEKPFGPRNLGAGPTGIARINVKTGEVAHVVSVPFQVGHIQANFWVPGEIVFCWETGGKSPQRTWTVKSDGSDLRPLYPEADYEWVTHEAIFSPDEVAFAIMGDRKATYNPDSRTFSDASDWGPAGIRMKPSGLAVFNLRTNEMQIAGQAPKGGSFWHVTGSADGKWLAGDTFERNVYVINRENNRMTLLTAGHNRKAPDHVHPSFSPDGTRIQIQSSFLSEDGSAMHICIIRLPENL